MTTRITITPVSPELQRLRRARDAYEAALADAVTTPTADGATPRDVAEATEVSIATVTALRTRPQTGRAHTPRKRKA
ncbi:hypothetical protein [Streptomyces sp. NPDC093094]|uniref:hypothetical protein n=1 Tax=Streptomyces sp. NPDC093094 TaxID=3366026 RepID=UPI0038098444